ncbi:MAG: helix-turn-helix domain containing protein, partial [Elusimicrobiota bacterium]|nr:helix-turn-helix domain containing protein [Elusimicrobiota bacterium]
MGAKKRKEAIEFYQKYGLNPALDAFHISRSTLFNWQQKFRDFGIYSLVDRRRCPRNKRQSQ